MSLYQDVILDHYRNPRHFGELPSATCHGSALNPTCGDRLQMDIDVRDGIIRDMRFSGNGCAISQASASLLGEYVLGKSANEARSLSAEDVLRLLGVTLSPNRLKCGLLSLETLHKALEKSKP